MSDVKYAIAILKEKLGNADKHNLQYQRFSIADMEAIWGVLSKCESDYAELKAQRDALAEQVKQLEWDSVFIPKDIEKALAVMGVALPESKEEFNFSINRWVQRLVDQVVRFGPALDAERNNLRAEGIEQWVASREPKWNGTTEDAKRFAAQLRAGKDGE